MSTSIGLVCLESIKDISLEDKNISSKYNPFIKLLLYIDSKYIKEVYTSFFNPSNLSKFTSSISLVDKENNVPNVIGKKHLL